jgi:hypothetical protein
MSSSSDDSSGASDSESNRESEESSDDDQPILAKALPLTQPSGGSKKRSRSLFQSGQEEAEDASEEKFSKRRSKKERKIKEKKVKSEKVEKKTRSPAEILNIGAKDEQAVRSMLWDELRQTSAHFLYCRFWITSQMFKHATCNFKHTLNILLNIQL